MFGTSFRFLTAMRGAMFCAIAIGLLSASTTFADSVEYSITVNTSLLAGITGSLDFNFNPGLLVTQGADLQILNFSSNGSLQNCASNVQGFCGTGDVSGTLPGTVTFDNGTAFNDYFDGFTFGNALSFDVTLYGPALTTPNGTATSGSTFAFSMFSDAAGAVPTLTTDLTDGFAATIDVNLDGTTTVTNFSPQTTVSVVNTVPEAGGWLSLAISVLGVTILAVWQRRTQWPISSSGSPVPWRSFA